MALQDLLIVIGLNTGVNKYIIINPNITHKKLIVIAIVFLYASFLFGLYISEKDPNAYEETGMTRSMNIDEINKAYKVEVKAKHPDKNPSPFAQQEFIKMQKNFQTIKSADLRLKYELYKTTEDKEIIGSLAKSIPFYLSNFLLSNGITYSKENGHAGRNSLLMIAGIGFYEYMVKVNQKFILYLNFLPLTVSEQIEAIQAIFPAIVLGMMLVNRVAFAMGIEKIKQKLGLGKNAEFRDNLPKLLEDAQSGNSNPELKKFIQDIKAIQSIMVDSDKVTRKQLAIRVFAFMFLSNFILNLFRELDE